MNPELMSFALDHGLGTAENSTPALFVADFIVTSSEVPPGGTDDERRMSIIQSFLTGLERRCKPALPLMRVFYLSQKTATLIRRNNAFLAGRGLDQETSMLILKDTFITPYLAVCEEILGKGNCGWELGILASALNQSYPHEELTVYLDAPEFSNEVALFPFMQRMLNDYMQVYKVEVNENQVIPNITDTSIVFIAEHQKNHVVSVWNTQQYHSKWVDDSDKAVITPLYNFLKHSDEQRALIYVRGKILGTDDKLMMVRNPFVDSKPLTLIRTPADEINLTKLMTTLANRAEEAPGWERIDEISEEFFEERQEVVEVEEPSGEPTEVPKRGFFARLFGRKPKPVGAKQPKKKKKVEAKQVKKVKKKKKRQYLPPFLSYNVGVEAVGDLELYEMFDTYRESQYLIIGALESDFVEGSTSFLTAPNFGNIADLADLLDGLDAVIENAANNYFKSEHQILPTELLFVDRNDNRFIISLDGNGERIVGTIAITHVKDVAKWQEGDQDEVLQRRSLHMRTGQLLAARQHTPFDTAVLRIYAASLGENPESHSLDHAILPIE
jgi:hypothetical protein